jgi:hypothetical protein
MNLTYSKVPIKVSWVLFGGRTALFGGNGI